MLQLCKILKHIITILVLHGILINAIGVEIGFNQSNVVTMERQSEPVNVCIQVTSGTLGRNVSVNLETLAGDSRGMLTFGFYIYTHLLSAVQLRLNIGSLFLN